MALRTTRGSYRRSLSASAALDRYAASRATVVSLPSRLLTTSAPQATGQIAGAVEKRRFNFLADHRSLGEFGVFPHDLTGLAIIQAAEVSRAA
jgi:hypothetical protein